MSDCEGFKHLFLRAIRACASSNYIDMGSCVISGLEFSSLLNPLWSLFYARNLDGFANEIEYIFNWHD